MTVLPMRMPVVAEVRMTAGKLNDRILMAVLHMPFNRFASQFAGVTDFSNGTATA